MEEIRIWAESLMQSLGIQPVNVVYAADALLVVFALLLSWLSFVVCHRLLVPVTLRITQKTDVRWDDILLNKNTLRKACLIVPAIVLWMFIPHIFYRFPDIEEILVRLTSIYITLTSTRLAFEVINSLKMLNVDERSAHHQYLHSFCGVLKIVVVFLAVIVVVSIIIDRNPLTLLAGLGATSAILMLVFKDTISGLVAGVRLTSNDMIHKGDWITVDKAGINGTVEEITLTTVKVRNFDNTIMTITPQTLVDDSFQNWKPMQEGDGRRVMRRMYFDFSSVRVIDEDMRNTIISRGYLTAKEMAANEVNLTMFRLWADKYLASHPLVNSDMMYMVRQLEATPTGLPVEFYFFLHEKQWKPYENQKDAIIERLIAAVGDFGLRIYQRV